MTIAEEIAALQTADFATLSRRYQQIFGRPPRSKNPLQVWRRVAWGIQAREYGGLSDAAKARITELNAASGVLPVEVRTQFKKPTFAPGTIIAREWRNQRIEVVVTDAGFVWNGVPYASLTAAVKAITGSPWNPYIFFGLTERKRK